MAPPLKLKLKILFLLLTSYYLLATNCYAQSQKCVRVAIIQDTATLRLKIGAPYEAIDSLSNKILYRANSINTTVTVYRDGILLGNIQCRTNKLFIRSANPEAILIDGRKFRGDIQFIKKANLHMSVINYIELEDYIKGILYHEVSHYWPMEALKAQALISRTYAVYQVQENGLKDFDVTSDIYSQVYGGLTSERYRTNKAVKETAGQILVYQEKVIPAYFHATCAGHTEDASLLWNIDLAPLKGVVCNFCKESPHFKWQEVLSKEELKEKLAHAGYKIKNIKDIAILGRDKSGRITDLKIISTEKETKIPAKDFRNAVGPNVIRSTNFSVSIAGDDVVFEGVGWGHGAGLCQWGAYFMAKEGFSYKDILKYYYPGTEIKLLVTKNEAFRL